MRVFGTSFGLALVALGSAGAAGAQQPTATVIAVPPLATPSDAKVGKTTTRGLAWEATQLIAADLQQSSEAYPLAPDPKDFYSYPEVTAPNFHRWKSKGAKLLLTGFVQARSDGRLSIGCYVYDVDKGREVARKGFVVGPSDWRRAAHKCSGLAYSAVTGSPGVFDTRLAYVAESGLGGERTKRIAVMDADGSNHAYVTQGSSFAITPRLAPDGNTLVFVSFDGGTPHLELADVASGKRQPLLSGGGISFSPGFSADGTKIAFTMMQGGNADVWWVGSAGGVPKRLTTSPGIDTGASWSPDSSLILFESDRSGLPQLYVMRADGSDQRRISFGGGTYSAPEWSPDGKYIAFTKTVNAVRRIGVMDADGTNETMLTSGPNDDSARWAPSSRELIFQRTGADGRNGLFRVSLKGEEPRQMAVPQDGSDPDWSGTKD